MDCYFANQYITPSDKMVKTYRIFIFLVIFVRLKERNGSQSNDCKVFPIDEIT